MTDMAREAAFRSAREWIAGVGGHIIGGETKAITGAAVEVLNPADETVLGRVAEGTVEDVEAAVSAARACFGSREWREMLPARREELLLRFAALVEENSAQLAAIETLDNGVPWPMALMMAGKGGPSAIRYNAGWVRRLGGETAEPSVPGRWHAYTVNEPLGVAGLIVPWNAPLAIACNKVSAALAAGCTAVLKPAELAPFSCIRLIELAHEAGFPAGAINLVNGTGQSAGAALAAHPGVDKISFTGSTMTGKAIMRQAAERVTRISLELGGKSPVVVFDDADLARAVPGVAMGIFANSGQVCAAGSRLFLHDAIYDRFMEQLCAFAARLTLGPGEQEGSALGPLISAAQRDKVEGYVTGAVEAGARLAFRGEVPGGPGYFVPPTILDRVTPDMRAVREEIFGPVLCVQRFSDDEELEALAARANDSEYGLSAYAWTTDLERAQSMARLLRAGSVKINGSGMEFTLPFGGFGQSGLGRENGRHGVLAFTETKSVMLGY
ncbi:betaine-aldehyde dehydrogenase [Erythrobacter sp. SG61-1L]|uniref:aldehyde dehydrogenase family protein n=1 Tax=Erythrobacter sp. SG61-1L TaxID=1603897 RepID=UPI0006C8EC3F|nr:aldehyde dehydrogenase family protein [Erythrobacter sp. SG61-1L]KPL68341.1 betaine-aldehyde dehydrogenase [Erythrobacter sp. SG61-1L]